MLDKHLKKEGRIYYIDPNTYTNVINSSDNIYYNQEDYNISIDLQVITAKRNDCGTINYGSKDYFIEINNDKYENSSFFEGSSLIDKSSNKTYKLLTSSNVDSSYSELLTINDGSNKELMGVESIDIDFSNWFYPRVSMKLIDVRGFSLMSPEEIDYTNMLSNSKNDSKSFFKAFFTYPYPIFLLKVKGFYGNAVTFTLSVEDFRTSFNSTTGNFEVNVNFIGYMYKFYTDIPLKFLIAAPYDLYNGKDYWVKNNFLFDDGTKIPTFIELLGKIEKSNEELKTISSSSANVKAYKQYTQQIDSLTNILSTYNSFIKSLGGNNNIIGNNNILVLGYQYDNGNNYAIYDASLLKDLIELIESYNSKNWGRLEFPNNDTSYNVLYECKKLYSTIKNENNVDIIYPDYLNEESDIYNDTIVSEWRERIDNDIVLKDKLRSNNNGLEYSNANNNILNKHYAFLYKTDGFSNTISSKIKELHDKQNSLNETISNEINTYATNILGFKPSVKNIFKITFAHLDTFLHSIYSCLNNVKGSNRLLSELGIDISNTDLNSNVNSNVFVPPFPLITNNKNEITWPGNIPSLSDMEEISLINGLFQGIIDCEEKLDVYNSELSSYSSSEFIPVNNTDLIMGYNPYKYIYENSDSTIKIDELMAHFALRAINHLFYQNINKNESILFGQADAYNYFLSHKFYDDRLMSILSSPDCNGDNFINYIKQVNDANGVIIYNSESNIPFFKFNGVNSSIIDNNKYIWITNENGISLLPVNFRSLNDIKNNTINYDYSMFISNNNNLIDDEFNEELINYNIANIYEDKKYFLSIKNNVLNNDYNLISDPDKIFNSWDLKTDFYYEFYKTNDFLSLKYKNDNVDDSISREPVKISSFFEDFNGNAEDIVKNYISNQLSDENVFLPTLQFGKNSCLYGNPFFYLQNDSSDIELSYIRKAILFLHSLPFSKKAFELFVLYAINKSNVSSIIKIFPKSLLLFVGSLLWRERYCKLNKSDCFINDGKYNIPSTENAYQYLLTNNDDYSLNILSYNDEFSYKEVNEYFNIKSYYITNTNSKDITLFDIRPEIKNILINNFLKWATDNSNYGFKYLNNELELKLKMPNGFSRTLNSDDLALLLNLWDCWDSDGNKIIDEKSFIENYNLLFNANINEIVISSLKDFFTNCFDDNFSENYAKIGKSKDLSSFLLLNNQNSRNINYLTQFFIDDDVLYLSKLIIKKNNGQNYLNGDITIDINKLKDAFNSFKNTLLALYKNVDKNNVSPLKTIKVDSSISVEEKLSAYLTLKNLYDRWLCANTHDKWNLKLENNEFENFVFIDSHYNDIGEDLIIDCSIVYELLKANVSSNDSNMSIYEFLSEIAQRNKLLFIAVPIYNSFKDPESIEELFTPISVNDSKINDINTSSTYMCIYMHEPSHILDMEGNSNDYGYINDGYDIADSIGNINNSTIPSDMLLNDNSHAIPSFGVTYGRQEQNFFKRVEVSMDNPQVTEYSLGAIQNIANSAKNGQNNQVIYKGQNLYPVYSNHSYTCTVDMMGCAPIMPMMYFQLNNIPLFKGAYIIISVKHHIESGNMTTTFTGVRQNKNRLPLNESVFSISPLLDRINRSETTTYTNNININYNYSNEDNVKYVKQEYEIPDVISNTNISYTYNDVANMKGKDGLPLIYFSIGDLNESGGPEVAFNGLQPNAKRLLVDIAKTVDKNFDYKILVTSLKRNGNGSSLHNVGLAMDLHGCEVNKNGTIIYRKKYSASLFDLIATNFLPYIKELLWENAKSDVTIWQSNEIDNCIHLGTYLPNENNNRIIISQTYNKGKSIIPITDTDTFYPLSRSFLKTCVKLIKNDKIGLNNIGNFKNLVKNDIKNDLLSLKL